MKLTRPVPESLSKSAMALGMIIAVACILYFSKELAWLKDNLVFQQIWQHFLGSLFDNFLLNPVFYVVVFGNLFFEFIIPAKQEQKSISKGFIQDAVFFIFAVTIKMPLILYFSVGFKSVVHDGLGISPLLSPTLLPQGVYIVLAVIGHDFMIWLRHYLLHKIPILWNFHAVHHAQTELNQFSIYREHIIERVWDEILIISTSLMIFPLSYSSVTSVILVSFFYQWHSSFCHSNIKTNLGFLGHFIVSPQYHRIHHSIEEQHRDKNFAGSFPIWDYLFNTQCKETDIYPETGISEPEFSVLKSRDESSFIDYLKFIYLQQTYPVLKLFGKTHSSSS